PYNGNSSQVKVTVAINGSGGLGSIFGISKPMISASAIATATSASTPITTALFAGGSNCTYAVNIDANNSSIPGGIETNGGVNLQGSNSSSFGTIDYNPSCGILNNGSMNNTYTPVKNSSTLPYPIDYRNQTITCTNGTMSVSNGVYSYSVSNDSYSSGNLAPGVYCAQSIDLTGTVSGSNVTFIADNLQLNSSGTFTAPSSTHLLVWETGTGELDVNSNTFLNSDVLFAPSATINVQSVIGTTYYTLLESNAVTLSSVTSGGSLTPPSGLTTTSSSTPGASQLSQ
ncbi:MAG: hypothetical protein JO206_10015, partial [Solirubrobacterales bacterium]|nr:hypothetical protein [Solirubrobacterales bacterium]MBV9473293.1 hypothetical protein [Solirubrobacterales bacterium]